MLRVPRFLRTSSGITGFALLVFVVGVALLGPVVAPHDPAESIGLPGAPPSSAQWLGTDELGRDVLSRVLNGGLTVLGFALAAAAFAYGAGILIGFAAGYSRRVVDGVLMRGMDVLLALPPMLFALVLIAGAGTGTAVLILAVGIIQMPGISRVVRAATLEVVGLAYVEAAVARGERVHNILRREILPNVAPTLLADFGLRFTYSVVIIASLNYLGLGLAPPASDWGLMIAENRQIISLNIWSVVAPAVMLALLTVAVNLVGDAYVASLTRRSR